MVRRKFPALTRVNIREKCHGHQVRAGPPSSDKTNGLLWDVDHGEVVVIVVLLGEHRHMALLASYLPPAVSGPE